MAKLKTVTFNARLSDGTTESVTGIALRKSINGKYLNFAVHPSYGSKTGLYATITELSTGLRLSRLPRSVSDPAAAKRLAIQKIELMLASGLGDQILAQVAARSTSTH